MPWLTRRKWARLTRGGAAERRRVETTVSTLMGKKPELRFAFIQENARFVEELDI